MREILSWWLEGQLGFNLFYDSSFSPTWRNMVDALRNYGESQLAAKLEEKYCTSEFIMWSVTRIYNAVQHGIARVEIVCFCYMTS